MMDDDSLDFLDEDDTETGPVRAWKILIVDDDPDIHDVTELALTGLEFNGRGLQFLHAYSGQEARDVIAAQPDIALVLLDVVMESDHAGLDVVEYVRNVLGNRFIRIILRTGQPGQAPEIEVITRYDINDYKHKTELTRQRLFTTIYTGLSAYRDLMALDANRRGLEKVIDASARIFELQSLERFAQGVIEQLCALLFLEDDAVMLHASSMAAADCEPALRILAGSGRFQSLVGSNASEALDADTLSKIHKARDEGRLIFQSHQIAAVQSAPADQGSFVVYLESDTPLEEAAQRLVEMFCRNVSIAWRNLRSLNQNQTGASAAG